MSSEASDGYRILIVDDDREMRDSLGHLLETAGWRVESVSRADGVNQLQQQLGVDVILSDVRMPGLSGIDLLGEVTSQSDAPPVILISAHGDIPMAVDAMQKGAYSFIEKPYDPHRLLTALRNAAARHRISQDALRLKARLANLSGLDRILLGKAESIRLLREHIVDIVDSDAPVMLLGETGTGKELVARALHDLSDRMSGPFIAVNCAALSGGGFEETIFGRRDGALGILTRADNGTLFLDEIVASPVEVQAKLLRIIETKEFLPVGADKAETVNIRFICASNEQVDQAISEGKFREDLFYRLNRIVVSLPTLRERLDDIPLLYAHFLEKFGNLYEITPPDTSSEDLAVLLAHDWPGNVRELSNVAERRILMARRGRGSVTEALRVDVEFDEVPETLRESVAAFERQIIAKAIRAHNGKMDSVAEALGIGRRTLNDKIVKLGLNKNELI